MSEVIAGRCSRCGSPTTSRDTLNPWDGTKHEPRFECPSCRAARERAYDNFVDPLHVYHQHDPDRICEG